MAGRTNPNHNQTESLYESWVESEVAVIFEINNFTYIRIMGYTKGLRVPAGDRNRRYTSLKIQIIPLLRLLPMIVDPAFLPS